MTRKERQQSLLRKMQVRGSEILHDPLIAMGEKEKKWRVARLQMKADNLDFFFPNLTFDCTFEIGAIR
jgi:hypothetical protein